ncbi:MAG: hypothetical protein HYU04_00430 [Candidatus Wildermuthbacteria bacterium]|nr:hypothetical protein [Candidatus Wildermuthbacteria bacterium]
MRKIFPILTILFLLFSAVPLTADAGIVQCGGFNINPDGSVGSKQPDCNFCSVFQLITGIINFFVLPPPAGFGVVPLIATLLILVGGFYILIAAGRPNLQSQGKSIITAVVIGLLVVYIAWVVVNSILTFLGVAQWTGLTDNKETPDIIEGWWQIRCGI